MGTQTLKRTAEQEVRELFGEFEKALKAKDLETIMSHYAPDVVAFDAIGGVQFQGIEAYRAHWAACFQMCPGPMEFRVEGLEIIASGDLAVSRHIAHCPGCGGEGGGGGMTMRLTVVYRRIGGTWKIVHEHASAPFDPATGKVISGAAA